MQGIITKVTDIVSRILTVAVVVAILIVVLVMICAAPTSISEEEAKELIQNWLNVELTNVPTVLFSKTEINRDAQWYIMALEIPELEDVLTGQNSCLLREHSYGSKKEFDEILYEFGLYDVPDWMEDKAKEIIAESEFWYSLQTTSSKWIGSIFSPDDDIMLCVFSGLFQHL